MIKKNNTVLYVIGTYILFLVSILMVGIVMLFIKNTYVAQLAVAVCSWTPTMMLLIMLPKLEPGTTRLGFIKKRFKTPIHFKSFLCVISIQVIVFIVSVKCLLWQKDMALDAVINLSLTSIITGFINSLISGATGEEAGWRGYLQPVMEKHFGVIRGSLVVGVIWGFWHTPLWFIASGYSGIELVIYIVLFLVFIISTALIMGIAYSSCRNLTIPIAIHFFVNFTLSFIKGYLLNFLGYLAFFYTLIALGFILWYKIRHK